ncbi:hypothetical protein [Senegalia sp. (in: firmicutes)]|uniref:hypothetical protein n=1 Tax=Senegalia sp. (in: firmicutes) TaxID=1924098 RepID=UPI003F99BF26
MMIKKDIDKFKPYWPETLIFWGAGATASLGLSSTSKIGEIIYILSDIDSCESLKIRINRAFPSVEENIKDELESLITILDEEKCDIEAERNLGFSKKRISELKKIYNFFILKEIMKRCPGIKNGEFNLVDLYNLIDLHIQTGQGFNTEKTYVRPEQLIIARNTLNMIISIIHAIEYRLALRDKRKEINDYFQFVCLLEEIMQNEGRSKINEEINLYDRDFYLFSYAIISMNWDPIFLWILFNAHRKLNKDSSIKLFTDLAYFMAIREIEGHSPSHFFPMNETAVQRLNYNEKLTGETFRIGKFYFPHGCHGFRECPNCGKLTFYLGDEWNIFSKTLFPPQIIPSLAYNSYRSFEEKEKHDYGKIDALQCTHCGHMTETHHTFLEMPTNFKARHPSFIQEIERDMKIAIQKAKHIIFMGYSLPKDDLIYRSILAGRKEIGKDSPKCSIVNFDRSLPDKWIYKDEILSYDVNNRKKEIFENISEIFGEDNIRFLVKAYQMYF